MVGLYKFPVASRIRSMKARTKGLWLRASSGMRASRSATPRAISLACWSVSWNGGRGMEDEEMDEQGY